jgi:phosphohistidine phosphatase
MKTVLLLRHAKSSWKKPELSDHDRPLNERGKSEAVAIGRLLQSNNLVPDFIVSSTAKRARRTADLVMSASEYGGDVALKRSLYEGGPDAYLDALAALPDDVNVVLVVGHNPDLENVVERLTGWSEELSTAALVQATFDVQGWSGLKAGLPGTFVGHWRAADLDERS